MMSKEQVKLNAFLQKEKIDLSYHLTFPMYNILPDEVQLALRVLGKHQYKITVTPIPREKDISSQKQKKLTPSK